MKLLLVLDLDETLIHASDHPLAHPADFRDASYEVYIRPHLEPFLEFCFAHFSVGIWTSASASYASVMLRRIMPQRDRLVFVYSGGHCTRRYHEETQEYYDRKPIQKLKPFGWPVEKIIAVDDSPEKWELSYGNLIRVRPFEGAPDDNELPALADYLATLQNCDDVRKIEKRGWRSKLLGQSTQ